MTLQFNLASSQWMNKDFKDLKMKISLIHLKADRIRQKPRNSNNKNSQFSKWDAKFLNETLAD